MLAKTLLKKLDALVKDNLSVRIVYGDPVKLESRTVIPVARAMFVGGGGLGFDDGPGSTKDSDEQAAPVEAAKADAAHKLKHDIGFGGGGMIRISPVGFISEKNGEAVFTKIDEIPMANELAWILKRLWDMRKKSQK
jgi:uncharacterized spore protein YtfJ